MSNEPSDSGFSLHPSPETPGVSGATLELPLSLETWFWDCDFRTLSWESNGSFIIRRILDRGDWAAVMWLRGAVGDTAIRNWILAKSGGGLDPRKLRFWGLILDLPVAKVDEWVRKARTSLWQGRRSV